MSIGYTVKPFWRYTYLFMKIDSEEKSKKGNA